MVVHFPAVAFDVVVFWRAFGDAEVFARDDYVRGVSAAGPFLAVGAVAVWVLRSAIEAFEMGKWSHGSCVGYQGDSELEGTYQRAVTWGSPVYS